MNKLESKAIKRILDDMNLLKSGLISLKLFIVLMLIFQLLLTLILLKKLG